MGNAPTKLPPNINVKSTLQSEKTASNSPVNHAHPNDNMDYNEEQSKLAMEDAKENEISLDFNNKTNKNVKSLSVNDFILLSVIGKGSFGKVFQARKKDNHKIYAMKVLKKSVLSQRNQIEHTKTERRVLQNISHPFVVSLRYAFQTEDKLYLVLDYFTGGELFYHLKKTGRFSENRSRLYAAEIVLALEALHKRSIIYRDLKPENILLDDEGHVRLTDFGLSKEIISESLAHTFCGTPEYLAPEILLNKGYGKAVDWWSLGMLLYEMMTGLPPFYHNNINVMYERILHGRLCFPSYLSPTTKNFLTGLIQRDPAKRLGDATGENIAAVKNHDFFSSLNWNKVYHKTYTPEFVPPSTSLLGQGKQDRKEDTINIDDEFRREIPYDTPVSKSSFLSNPQNQMNFDGFTYISNESNFSVGGASFSFRNTSKSHLRRPTKDTPFASITAMDQLSNMDNIAPKMTGLAINEED